MIRTVLKPVAIVALCIIALSVNATVCQSDSDYGRDELRMFYTAPPVIPHETDDEVGDTCVMCHTDVVQLGDRVSVPAPHLQYSNCLQCHVTSTSHDGQDALPIVNDWVGLEEPTDGEQLNDFAPPTVPHRLFLRENCLSCHNHEHPNEDLRCDHPERSNCLSCHVADPGNEFSWR